MEGEKLTFEEAKEYILSHAFAEAGDTKYVILPTGRKDDPIYSYQAALFDRQGNQVSPILNTLFTFVYDDRDYNIENGFVVTRNSILKLK